MVDGSHLLYEENVALARKVVEYAHPRNVTVEAELGRLAGIEDDVNVSTEKASYMDQAQVEDFVERTGVDSLAIAIETSHGAYKFKPVQKSQLRFDLLRDIEAHRRTFHATHLGSGEGAINNRRRARFLQGTPVFFPHLIF